MRPCILTVDDSKALRLLVEKLLTDFDCEPAEAANGFNAFFAIERTRPALILLDVSMPVMDGLEMLRRLKEAPELAAIPVLMMMSPADHAVMAEIRALGVSDTIMKPFKPVDLLAKILALLPLNPRVRV